MNAGKNMGIMTTLKKPTPERGRGAGAQALECFDTHQVGQEPPSRAGRQVQGAPIPAEGRHREARAATGHLGAGTPRQAACNEYMVEVRAPLIRPALSGGTAVALGEAGPGSDRSLLRPGGQPLQRHGVAHLGASWAW